MSVTLKIKNLSFSYPASQVLRGMSFEVSPGDFIGVVGPNGSGKSTLMKNMTRYLIPDEGAIALDDRELSIYSRKELSKRQAVVSQDNTINFNFTAYELVAMGRTPYMGRFSRLQASDQKIIQEVMEETNCWHLKDREIYQLSGGEKQRVIMARALSQTPDLLLLDEPTTFLDIGHQKELMDLLTKLNREKNLTVVMVLHDLNLASEYCRDLLLVDEGEIVALGSPEAVLSEENLTQVYKAPVTVIKNPLTGKPLISLTGGRQAGRCGRFSHQRTPSMPETLSPSLAGMKVHVIGGGGRSEELLDVLYDQGVELSLGVVNLGDSDERKAQQLGIDAVICEPFTPIDEESFQKGQEKIARTEAVILSPVPFGHGNIQNLELVRYAIDCYVPVLLYMIDEERVSDYTKGEATKILKIIHKTGARVADSLEAVLTWLQKCRES